MELYQRGKVFWCTFIVDGVRYRKSTREKTKSAAGTAAAKLLLAAKEGRGLTQRKVPTLAGFSAEYLAHERQRLQRGNLAPATLKSYEYGWQLLSSQAIAKVTMDRITTVHVAEITVKAGPSTLNTALRTLRRMLSLAVEIGLIRKERPEGQPRFPKISLAKESRRSSLITEDDDDIILAVLKSKRPGRPFGALKTAWVVHVDCGLRPIEVVSLRIEDLDFIGRTLRVSTSKTRSGLRILPMTDRVCESLIKQVSGRTSGWVYPSPSKEGMHIGPRTLSRSFAAARKRANLTDEKKLYSTRHSFGSDMMRLTKDPYLVMEMMGHSNLASGKPYQHKETAMAASAMDLRLKEREERQANRTVQ